MAAKASSSPASGTASGISDHPMPQAPVSCKVQAPPRGAPSWPPPQPLLRRSSHPFPFPYRLHLSFGFISCLPVFFFFWPL